MEYCWTPTGEIPVSKIPLEPPEGLILYPALLSSFSTLNKMKKKKNNNQNVKKYFKK